MVIPAIVTLIEKARYQEAFAACEELLSNSPEQTNEILRTRAYCYARSGDHRGAFSDYETIISGPNAEMRDYYSAAYHALYVQKYLKAEEWFLHVQRLGVEQDNDWFHSATLFYL